jgi:hypothetical protein
MNSKQKVSDFSNLSEAINFSIQKSIEETPLELYKLKPKHVIAKMEELFDDFKISGSAKTMISILLKRRKSYQTNNTSKSSESTNKSKFDEITKLALRLIIASGSVESAKDAIDFANKLVND